MSARALFRPVHRLAGAMLLAAGLAPLAALARSDSLPAPVAQALASAAIPRSHVAVRVEAVGSTEPLVSVNAGAAMNPASVIKLLTTYAALELLGPAHTWTTGLFTTGELRDGVLAGDLYLQGSGDPKLTFEQFWLLLRSLRARGVRDIRGDLILDRSLFAPARNDPFDEHPLRAYNVGPDALLLGFNALRFTFVPDTARAAVTLLHEPQPVQLDVVNLLKLGGGPCNEWRDHVRLDISKHGPNTRLVLTGSYPAACGEKTWNLGVMSHGEFVSGVFRQLWRELGGTIEGSWREAAVPAGARPIATIESAPLAEMVRDINKWSNNVMARQLYLTLGAATGARPAREADGEAAIRAWLARKDIAMPELVIENGSGLSRQARLSAESTARLMQAAWNSAVMPEFVASLPVVAVDGTMRKRLNGNGTAGQAHVKTGSLDGVKTIAGYVLDRSGRRWIVVFFVNHANAAAARPAQDALIEWVHAR